MFAEGTWHQLLEYAQDISGIVQHQFPSPHYRLHLKLWSLWNQICALFLYLGASEKGLALVVSGLWGMLSFQALAIGVFALSRDSLLSFFAPFVIYLTGAVSFGDVYPVWLMGHAPSLGGLGLSFIFLVLALISCGSVRLGGFLLGIAPAVHPSLGMLCWMVVAICLLWDHRRLGPFFGKAAKFFLIGLVLSVASLAFQLYVASRLPPVSIADASDYFHAFIHNWDNHRRPVNLLKSSSVYVGVGSLLASGLLLWRFKASLPQRSLLLLRVFVLTALIGVGFALASWLPVETLPIMVHQAMPVRWLNVNVMGFPVLLLGLTGRYRNYVGVQVTVCFVMGAILLGLLVYFLGDAQMTSVSFLNISRRTGVLIGMFLSGLALLLSLFMGEAGPNRRLYHFSRRIVLVAGVAVVMIVGLRGYSSWQQSEAKFRDSTNDPFFAEVARGRGMILTSSDLSLIQLRTRRPVLMTGNDLDGPVPYLPSTGPEVNRILKEVYGVDLFDPPQEIRKARPGGLLPETGKALWEFRTAEEWQAIKEQFGVTSVVCYADWKLKLKEVASNTQYVLYEMP